MKKRNTFVGITLLLVGALMGGIGAVPIRAATCPSATSTATSGDVPVTGTVRACASVAATNYRVTVVAKQGTATTTIFDVKPVALDSTETVVGTWALGTTGTYTVITKLLRSGALVTKSTITVTVGGTTPPPAADYDVAAAGDIATSGNGDTKTSDLVLALNPRQVYTLGDNVYPSGTATPAPYIEKYGPTWGRFLAKTFPTVGNHDYYPKLTGGGYGGPGGYQAYFADSAGGGDLNYSHTFDEWLVVHLDSEGPTATALAHLEGQLASTSTSCQIVISHHPYHLVGRARQRREAAGHLGRIGRRERRDRPERPRAQLRALRSGERHHAVRGRDGRCCNSSVRGDPAWVDQAHHRQRQPRRAGDRHQPDRMDRRLHRGRRVDRAGLGSRGMRGMTLRSVSRRG